jgi:CSLREA domain-containing protein
MFTRIYFLTIFIITFLFISNAGAATFTVTKTADTNDGVCNADCSLREAMSEANLNGAGADTINFNIPGGGVKTINITSPLPYIQTSLTINGISQNGYFGKPMIEVNGAGASDSFGFDIETPTPFAELSVTIIAIAITHHVVGVYSHCVPSFRCDVTLLGNFIGTDPSGTVAAGNSSGVWLQPSSNSVITIGGDGVFEGNLISGNYGGGDSGRGIEISYASAANNHENVRVDILGNKIGTDYTGNVDLGNHGTGIEVSEFGNDIVDSGDIKLTIGGTTALARNIISGNKEDGIDVRCDDATIIGNYIGTNVTGTAAIANGSDNDFSTNYGITITAQNNGKYKIGGTGDGKGNVVSGNYGGGIKVATSAGGQGNAQLFVYGNYIGTNAAGTTDLGNDGGGFSISGSNNYIVNTIIGDGTPEGRNIISGNGSSGISIDGGTAGIYGNYIGTDKTGTVDLGNDSIGINVVYDGKVTIGGTFSQNGNDVNGGNVISGNTGNGIQIPDFANFPVVIKRNRIGTNAAGTSAIPNTKSGISVSNSGTIIGSDFNADDGNLISGNGENGISIYGNSGNPQNTKVFRNFIGTNGVGGDFLPNGKNGIEIAFSSNNQIGLAGNGITTNIISGNAERGIYIHGADAGGNRIENNIIGPGIIGNDLGNTKAGIEIAEQSQGNFIGATGGGNTIAFNATGVRIFFGQSNEIRRNSIYSNDGLGIDLEETGVTPNDPGDGDGGSNNKQNFPVISRATPTAVSGTLNSTPNGNFTIDFYRNDACDASGNGEGRYYLGSTFVSTNAAGNGSFNFPATLALGQFVAATATVTDIFGADDTSEFSNCLTVTPAPTVSFSAANYTVSEGSATRTIVVNRAGATGGVVTVDYTTAAGTATAGQDYTEKSGTLTFGDGETIKTFDVSITGDSKDEDDETVNLTLSNPTGGAALALPSAALLTIIDNDNPPTVSVTDVSKAEGSSGTTDFTFQVNLSAESGKTVTVNFTTADGSADLGDYVGLSGLLTFTPGQTSKNLVVSVIGDQTEEPDQNFFVNLSNPANATLADAQGTGTILNDDSAYNIRGTVRLADLTPVGGVTIQLAGPQNAQTTTDANGRYIFQNLSPNGSVTVSPSFAGYTFSPVNRQYPNLAGDVDNADFTAVPAPLRAVEVISGFAVPGHDGGVTLALEAQGNENSVAFSLSYDSSLIFNPQVSLGSDALGATLVVDNSMSDKVGVSITLPAGQTFASGFRNIAKVMFNTTQTNAASTPVTFADTPLARQVLDAQSGDVQANFVNGFVFFFAGYESDVSPRPNGTGDGFILADDIAQIGKFVTGIDTIPALNPANEFQRADSAPRSTSGNGTLAVSDVVQAGRYAAFLDAAQPAGGALSANLLNPGELRISDDKAQRNPKSEIRNPRFGTASLVPSAVNVVNAAASPGMQVTVSIETNAQGTENGFGFTLGYDPAKLGNPVVQPGSGAPGALLVANTSQSGKIAVVLTMPAGQTLAAGTRQIVTVQFNVAANAPVGPTPLTFSDLPTLREVADANAAVLQSIFTDGAVNILGPTAAEVTIGGRIRDQKGNPLGQVRVTLTAPDGQTRTATSTTFGNYRFPNVEVGETYVLTVSSKRYFFADPTQIVNVADNAEDIDFVGLNR